MEIGCLECGLESKVVGVLSNIAQAEAITNYLNDEYRWGSDVEYCMFQIPDEDFLEKKYNDIITSE